MGSSFGCASSWNSAANAGSGGSSRRLLADDPTAQTAADPASTGAADAVATEGEMDLGALQQLSERTVTFPDVSTGVDVAGPYEEQMAHPVLAKDEWQGNATEMLTAMGTSSWS